MHELSQRAVKQERERGTESENGIKEQEMRYGIVNNLATALSTHTHTQLTKYIHFVHVDRISLKLYRCDNPLSILTNLMRNCQTRDRN